MNRTWTFSNLTEIWIRYQVSSKEIHLSMVFTNVLLLYSLSFPLEHKALTTSFHPSWSLAALFTSSQVMLNWPSFQVKHGLSLLCFLCGFQSKAWWVMFVCSRHMVHVHVHVCPFHLHFLLWIVSVTGSCPVFFCQSSWLEMCSGHLCVESDRDRC